MDCKQRVSQCDARLRATMTESAKKTKSSWTLAVCVLFLLSTELAGFLYLHGYIAAVERRCFEEQRLPLQPTPSSRRRRAATLEDNAVTTADDANVEFFNPKLRPELDDRRAKGFSAGGDPSEGETANNPWVWLTSYSRIPVSSSIYWVPRKSQTLRREIPKLKMVVNLQPFVFLEWSTTAGSKKLLVPEKTYF